MFFWWGNKNQVRKKPGGRTERAFCPECQAQTRFVECEATSKITVFSVVELDSSTETVFRCCDCGGLFHMQEDAGAAADEPRARESRAREPSRPSAPPAPSAEDHAAQRQKRERQADAELAALKKKMGL